MPATKFASEIKRRALEIGFDLVGIAPVEVGKDLEFARQWVRRGFGGEMEYLANPKRHDLRLVFPSVKSAICVGLIYNTAHPYSTQARSPEGSRQKVEGCPAATAVDSGVRAWISRYAWGEDYHDVMRARLEKLRDAIDLLAPGTETRAFVDTGPVVERAFARFSSIGWMGKNTCLINEGKGSWFFLGVILTNLELAPDLPAPDRCGSCTVCLEACPTGALVEPYVMDASRCISYLTIELKGSIPEEFRPAVGANIFGCDICQDACPWNSKSSDELQVTRGERRGAVITSLPELQPLELKYEGEASRSPEVFSLFDAPLDALASLAEEDFRRLFAHSPIKRAKYRGWLRNLCVAMGNSRDRRFIPRLEQLSHQPDPVVGEHAAWALKRLRELPPLRPLG
jgi:epoxyqueuosine reductase